MLESQQAFSNEEQVAFLNRMLEAERAGANALLNILEEHPRSGEAWITLRRVHGDEAHNRAKQIGVERSPNFGSGGYSQFTSGTAICGHP